MKRTIFVLTTVLFFALTLSACKKEYNKREYPSTAHVIRRAVTDIDGNVYDAVKIGNQVWMAENLRTTRYANGDLIPVGTSSSEYDPYRYIPNNDESLVSKYGYLYNYVAVAHGEDKGNDSKAIIQGVCPKGWHLPSKSELEQLVSYMSTQELYCASGNSNHLAKALASTSGWAASTTVDAVGNNQTANNATGFTALPIFNDDEVVDGSGGFYCFFWCGGGSYVDYEDHHLRAKGYYLTNDNPEIEIGSFMGRGRNSVRCIRN